MHRPPKNRAVYSASVNLLWGWELNLVIIIKVKVGTGEEVIAVIKICTLKLNLFRLVARVSYYRVYRRELKLTAACLTIL